MAGKVGMTKKIPIALAILAIIAFNVAVISRDVVAYTLCYQMLLATALFCLTFLLAKIAWQKVPDHRKRAYEGKRFFFDTVIIVSAFFFIIVGKFIRTIWLSDASVPITLFGFVATSFFAVYILWGFTKGHKRVSMLVGGALFISVMLVLYVVKSITFVSDAEVTVSGSTNTLGSLPYVAWTPAEDSIEKSGVTLYNKELAFDGLNLYASWTKPEAYLIDMHGNIIHKWSVTTKAGSEVWYKAELCQNGDLLVAVRDSTLMCLDWDSNIKWSRQLRAHHDIAVEESGMIYALARQDRLVFYSNIPVPIVDDYIAVLSPDGQLKRKIYLYDLARKHVGLSAILRIYKTDMAFFKPRLLMYMIRRRVNRAFCLAYDTCFDLLHTNSIEILDRNIDGFCKRGDWLVSIREIDLIGVIDPDTERFVWTWGPGDLDGQHGPSLLSNGNVLIFDNGPRRGFSRVLELNPLSGDIEWEYKSKLPEDFFCGHGGFCQRLPNGNTLITDTSIGRAFEVTKGGRIVWEFYNPRTSPDTLERETIYRLERIVNPEMIQDIQMRIGQAHN